MRSWRRIALHAVRDGGVFQPVEQCVDGVVHPVRDGAPLGLQPIRVALKPCDEDSGRPAFACTYTCAPLLDQQRTVARVVQRSLRAAIGLSGPSCAVVDAPHKG